MVLSPLQETEVLDQPMSFVSLFMVFVQSTYFKSDLILGINFMIILSDFSINSIVIYKSVIYTFKHPYASASCLI